MKIAIYSPSLNEFENLRGWLASCVLADYVVIADTGSTDGSMQVFPLEAQSAGIKDFKLQSISIVPFRFDDAHNAALALVPSDADVCIPLHLDERLMGGWRAALEAKWMPETTKAFYTYAFDPTYSFLQNRIHARKGYRWKYPDHEGVYPYGDTKEVSVTIPELRIEQTQDRAKDRSGILERLRWGVAEYPNDPRMLHYLGRELMYRGEYREAISLLEAYLRMPPTFPLERAQTAEHLAECWRRIGG